MGLGSILKGIAGVGSIAAAPLTGGTSLAWLPAALGGAAAVGGALSNTQGARTTTSTPTFGPEYSTLAGLLRSRAEDRLRTGTDLGGYTANGISGINNAFGGVKQTIDNNLTSRGLGTSPVAGAVDANAELARAGNISQFLNNLPLLQRQLQTEDMNAAGDVLNMGRGTSTVLPGSAAGSAFGSAAEMLAFLHGQGIFGQGGNTVAKLPGSIATGDFGRTPPFVGGVPLSGRA